MSLSTNQLLDLTQISEPQFMQAYGGLYEHSPWVAEAVWADIKSDNTVEVSALQDQLKIVVDNASKEKKLALLRAHPELAGKAAIDGELTPESTDEQSRARLDLCSTEEFETFQRLNAEYNDKFKFPFIMAVRNSSRDEILKAFESRVNNPPEIEFDTALAQVHIIASLRLQVATASDLSNKTEG